MVDRENREDWRRERSLLALGQAMRGEDDASLVSIGDRADSAWREDAATRHRLARSRREVQANPAPSAAGTERFRTEPEAAVGDDVWRAQEDAGDLPPAMPYSRQSAEERSGSIRSHDTSGSRQDDQQWKPLIDPMQVVRGIARSKLLIITTTLIGAGLGIAIALSTPKKYEATAELIVDPRDLKLTDRDLTQNVVASDATLAIVENQVRVLTSGTVLNKVVDKLNLANDPEFNGQGAGGLGIRSLIRSILPHQDGPSGADEVRRRALAVGNLAESLSVERGGKTFVITVSAITQNGEKSALIANTMTDVFLQTFGQIQSATAGRATDELTARLDELRKGVEAAERKVEEFRASHDLVDAQGHLISDDEMLKLNEQLSVARARTLELNARAASARSIDVNSVLAGTLPEEINSNTMSDLRSQYATLKQEADRAAIRLGPRHPELQALNAQIAGARDRIAGELRRIASSLQVDLKRAVQLEQDLSSRLAQLKVRSGDVNSDLVSMRELEREAAAKRSVYEQYLLRAKETGEQKDINTANMNVISKAFAPLEAKGPSRAVMALAGLLLGLASGIGLGAMRGAYESLRETAASRSRRDRKAPVEDQAFRAAPPPAPPMPAAPVPPVPPPPPAPPPPLAQAEAAPAGRPGRVAAIMAKLRNVLSRKPSAELDDDSEFAPFGDNARPADAAMPSGFPNPDSAFMPRSSVYSRPPLPPGFDASYSQPMGPPSRSPLMPPLPIYPAPPPYPPAGYPYTQAMAPNAGHMPYPPQAAPPAYQPQPSVEPSPVEEGAEQAPIEEIRASLREFREAVRELTESRARRRYF
ncbi:succinoglycan biosynthesis protein exop [Mesorhizobium sp. WSM4307]|uniref:GumC family protein n=1 Tax=unclassified Mesorhizobium TaxID=325217 RepID=UPI00115F6B09|nr:MULTISPECIES: GumC family protein [unclassified Mesorhizobium]TRC72133.1 succinoglycan biosynthesis protein exop [Mesorhizobium sp. WSM4315]TRC88139.1 succinoglycan biosynthesis protein exop [Mesorhizobium sp. WSM4307]